MNNQVLNAKYAESVREIHYKHFDKALHLLPPNIQEQIKSFVKSSDKVASHAFFPLIAFDKEERHINLKNKLSIMKIY